MNRSLTIASLVALFLLGGALYPIASELRIEYHDGFDYLRNARVLRDHGEPGFDVEYLWRRPPLIPLLQSLVLPEQRERDQSQRENDGETGQ